MNRNPDLRIVSFLHYGPSLYLFSKVKAQPWPTFYDVFVSLNCRSRKLVIGLHRCVCAWLIELWIIKRRFFNNLKIAVG
jgi:hypothetical protein